MSGENDGGTWSGCQPRGPRKQRQEHGYTEDVDVGGAVISSGGGVLWSDPAKEGEGQWGSATEVSGSLLLVKSKGFANSIAENSTCFIGK
ncbi:hypothetical protein K1719_027925 [Acacia pycnantha]|nr:hypothetical protein K1719_027925 [Acacia pycnantha]